MTPKEEKELFALVKENNEILRKMRRAMFWSRVFRVLYILIILGVTFGAYYFIQPYLEGVIGAYNQAVEGANQVKQTGSSLPDIGKFLNFF